MMLLNKLKGKHFLIINGVISLIFSFSSLIPMYLIYIWSYYENRLPLYISISLFAVMTIYNVVIMFINLKRDVFNKHLLGISVFLNFLAVIFGIYLNYISLNIYTVLINSSYYLILYFTNLLIYGLFLINIILSSYYYFSSLNIHLLIKRLFLTFTLMMVVAPFLILLIALCFDDNIRNLSMYFNIFVAAMTPLLLASGFLMVLEISSFFKNKYLKFFFSFLAITLGLIFIYLFLLGIYFKQIAVNPLLFNLGFNFLFAYVILSLILAFRLINKPLANSSLDKQASNKKDDILKYLTPQIISLIIALMFIVIPIIGYQVFLEPTNLSFYYSWSILTIEQSSPIIETIKIFIRFLYLGVFLYLTNIVLVFLFPLKRQTFLTISLGYNSLLIIYPFLFIFWRNLVDASLLLNMLLALLLSVFTFLSIGDIYPRISGQKVYKSSLIIILLLTNLPFIYLNSLNYYFMNFLYPDLETPAFSLTLLSFMIEIYKIIFVSYLISLLFKNKKLKILSAILTFLAILTVELLLTIRIVFYINDPIVEIMICFFILNTLFLIIYPLSTRLFKNNNFLSLKNE